jgi:hypothetical protein
MAAADFVDFVDGFADERDLAVWQAIVGGLRGVWRLAGGNGGADAVVAARVRRLVRPVVESIGWSPAPGEDAPPAPEGRLVAMGDSDFAANYGLGIQGNRDLFLNTLGWLSRQEGLIAVRPKSPEDRRLTLTADQLNKVAVLSIFLIPAAIFGLGIYTWWRRR